jgi:hypothetical protein
VEIGGLIPSPATKFGDIMIFVYKCYLGHETEKEVPSRTPYNENDVIQCSKCPQKAFLVLSKLIPVKPYVDTFHLKV